MRAFVALDLPEALIEPLTRLQAGLTTGRAVPEENLHLTLAFLGDVPDNDVGDLAEALACVQAAAFDLTLKGLDLFGGRKPGVLFARASGAGMSALHDKITHAVRETGLRLPRDRFRPHVTIARFAKGMSAKDQTRLGEFLALNGAFSAPPAPATGFSLYRSHLRPEGPIHEPLASFDLTR